MPIEGQKLNPTRKRAGRPKEYDPATLDRLLTELFEEHGKLRADDREWNSQTKAAEKLADLFQERHPKERVPGLTVRKEHVADYLARHPQFSVEN
jgi:hypothetical protein